MKIGEKIKWKLKMFGRREIEKKWGEKQREQVDLYNIMDSTTV